MSAWQKTGAVVVITVLMATVLQSTPAAEQATNRRGTVQKALSETEQLEKDLKTVERAYLDANSAEDADAVMSSLHSEALDFGLHKLTRDEYVRRFKQANAKFSMDRFALVGTIDDLVVVSVEYNAKGTRGTNAKPFHVTFAQLHVFKREDGRWKIWRMAHMNFREMDQ